MIWLTLILVALAAAYIFLDKKRNHWRNMGVQQKNPLLLFGDILPLFFKRETVIEFCNKFYFSSKSR